MPYLRGLVAKPATRMALRLAAAVPLLAGQCAIAEVKVSGTAAAVVVEANQEKLKAVLDSLSAAHAVRVESKVPLDTTINGTYRGNVTSVLARLLADYSHTVRRSDGGMTVTILGLRATPTGEPQPSGERLDPPPTTANQRLVSPASTPAARPQPPGTPQLSAKGEDLRRRMFGENGPKLYVPDENLSAYSKRGMARRGALNNGAFTGQEAPPP